MVCTQDRIFKNETVPLKYEERLCYSQRSEGVFPSPFLSLVLRGRVGPPGRSWCPLLPHWGLMAWL